MLKALAPYIALMTIPIVGRAGPSISDNLAMLTYAAPAKTHAANPFTLYALRVFILKTLPLRAPCATIVSRKETFCISPM